MRAGAIVAGAIVLVLGFAMAGIGGAMKGAGDTCVSVRCDSDEAVMMGIFGTGILYAGMLLGLTGIGILVAGILAPPKVRSVPVAEGAPPTRPCPQCSAAMGVEARFCGACGASVAPVLKA